MKELNDEAVNKFLVIMSAIDEKMFPLEEVLSRFEESELATLLLRVAGGDPKNLHALRNLLDRVEGASILPEHVMHFAGVIDSEETFAGTLPDGREIFVGSIGLYDEERHPEHRDPLHWLKRLEAGEFDDPDNYPLAWTQKGGKREWRDVAVHSNDEFPE